MLQAVREYDAKIDSRRRLTLRSTPFNYYHVAEYEDGKITLEPRELTVPFQVSANTLDMMDSAVQNIKAGMVSEEIDLSEFKN
ncbi:MAG: hypothetical protein IJR68_06340 [Fretibacterium sp.]|nr:hypothetical protein [Fretibacterium sp.]